jgi:hypothetical protein
MRDPNRSSRRATAAVLDAVEAGTLDPTETLRTALAYMSEDEVADMARINELLPRDEEE